jgi:hypothetical protein
MFVTAVSIWAIDAPEPLEAPITFTGAAVQVKVVPATFEDKAIFVVCPLQIVSLGGVAVATGNGLTVTVALMGVPTQPLATGVML